MRWPLALVGIALLLGGCRSSGSQELVEQELSAREDDVRQLEEELHNTTAIVHSLQAELGAIRGGVHHPPLSGSPIRKISLGRLTAGLDTVPGDGDDALQVLLVPEDVEGHAVKIPGTAYVEAYEITPEGTKTLLSTWHVAPDQLSSSWRNGLLATGYSLILPWRTPPVSNKLRVVARLQLASGKTFEADKDITIRVPAYRKRRMPRADETRPPTVPSGSVLPTVPPTTPELPAPTPVEPSEVLPMPTPLPLAPKPSPTFAPATVEPEPKPIFGDPWRLPIAPPVELKRPQKGSPVPPIPAVTLEPAVVERIKVATSEPPKPIAQSGKGPSTPHR